MLNQLNIYLYKQLFLEFFLYFVNLYLVFEIYKIKKKTLFRTRALKSLKRLIIGLISSLISFTKEK